ncbi:MAG: TetR/AcrR family transcriptional regulator, partial [Acidobacteriota bacterium]|nr:TetR/AcrR family transcriptional regulator [Acidobacteriota bacterium]
PLTGLKADRFEKLMAANLSQDFTRYDQKLEFILRNSARIFAEKGYHSTSMRDISRETNVSLAGLYYYCKSKEELLFLIQDNCFGRVLERLQARLKETTEPVAKLRLVIDNHLSFFAANMAEMKVLSHEADSLEGEMQAHVSGQKQQYTKLVRRLLSEVQQAQTGGTPKVDLTVATYALFGMMNWIYNWYDPVGALSVNGLVDNITRLFLNGFLAGADCEEIQFTPRAARTERLSVWRAPQT